VAVGNARTGVLGSKYKNQIGNIGRRNTWQAWTLLQDKVWVNQRGDVIMVDSIPSRYALNILKFVYRLHEGDIPEEQNGGPMIKALSKIVIAATGLYQSEIDTLVLHQPRSYEFLADPSYYDDFGYMD
jgi:hypothetical protein